MGGRILFLKYLKDQWNRANAIEDDILRTATQFAISEAEIEIKKRRDDDPIVCVEEIIERLDAISWTCSEGMSEFFSTAKEQLLYIYDEIMYPED